MLMDFREVLCIAIRGWPETLRLCLIIVVAATAMLYFYLMGVPVLPVLMR